MPSYWYNYYENVPKKKDDEETIQKKNFNIRIVADTKPYFMNYIYPQQMSKYQKYIKNANIQSLEHFGITLDELLAKTNRSEEEENFVIWYYKKCPVGMNKCVMNRLCWLVEDKFKGYVHNLKENSKFNKQILKLGVEYDIKLKKQQQHHDYLKK